MELEPPTRPADAQVPSRYRVHLLPRAKPTDRGVLYLKGEEQFLLAWARVKRAFAAQVGAGFTAELGAMRISEEIDALEVMSVPSKAYLVATRVVAALLAIVPLYLISLFASFFATKLVTTEFFGLSPGVYDYYFRLYLPAKAMNLLARLNEKDLKMLSIDRNVPEVLRLTARKKVVLG